MIKRKQSTSSDTSCRSGRSRICKTMYGVYGDGSDKEIRRKLQEKYGLSLNEIDSYLSN